MAFAILFELSRAFALVIAYILILAIYRLYFSPLAKFPGPKIAAVTSLYHYYYDVIKGGQYVFVVEEMHKKYGPIVRIRPDVLHMNDPEYIDPILGGPGKRRDKYKIQLNGAGAPEAAFGTEKHELHRRRRAPLNPFFSKQNIRRLEPVLHLCLEKVLRRLAQNAESGEPMKMNMLFNATTSDIISDYCFGESYNNLDKEDLNEPYFLLEHDTRQSFHFATFSPWLLPVIKTLPEKVVLLILPSMKMFIEGMKETLKRIEIVKKEIKGNSGTDISEKTIFHSLLMNPNVPDQDRTEQRMAEEARILLLGGTDTTALTLSAITYQILANPIIFKKLKAELIQAIPDPDTLPVASQIEALPYLTAVIEEGIRLHPVATTRQERVAPDEDLIYQDAKEGRRYVIPRGTPVGICAPIMNMNEDLYPSPTVFDPNRYLENPRLDKYRIAFSRGPRRCLGMNLAYSELYMLIAGIFRKYDLYDGTGKQTSPTLELYQTTREDVDMGADSLTLILKDGSVGVRVIVR